LLEDEVLGVPQDLYVEMGKQLFVPPKIVGRATFRSDNQVVVFLVRRSAGTLSSLNLPQ
jgi:hypothetical protein